METLAGFAVGLVDQAQAALTEGAVKKASGTTDFSVMAMFLRATLTVQVTMAVLVLASFWSWAIIVEKIFSYGRLNVLSRQFEDQFWSGQPVDGIFQKIQNRPRAPVERVFVAGMTEWHRSFAEGALIPGTQSRVDRAMNVAIARESEAVNRRLGFLASVGSTAPFVGLFGTVWGIKHAFENIATQQNTNLVVVAPGIAEALLATALGLLAAIPAVIGYNRLLSEADGLTTALENFADEFSTILARQIDRHHGAPV